MRVSRNNRLNPCWIVSRQARRCFWHLPAWVKRLPRRGLGFFIDDASLQWFPVAVRDTYGYWAAPVFFYEALARAGDLESSASLRFYAADRVDPLCCS